MTFAGGMTVDMRVERVEEPTVFAYTWQLPDLPMDDPRRTYVEFTLEPDGDGTLLRVVETGFAQLPVDTRSQTYDSHSEGWSRELAELTEFLDGIQTTQRPSPSRSSSRSPTRTDAPSSPPSPPTVRPPPRIWRLGCRSRVKVSPSAWHLRPKPAWSRPNLASDDGCRYAAAVRTSADRAAVFSPRSGTTGTTGSMRSATISRHHDDINVVAQKDFSQSHQ